MNSSLSRSDHPVIQTSGLQFSFGRRRILKNLDIKVPCGSIYGFLGPNGAGKTTTIKCLIGLYQVASGMIHIFGKELNSKRISILSRTGNMVEDPSLYGHLSAVQNLNICRIIRKIEVPRIMEVLDLVGLRQEAHRPVKQYSSGMKQRLVLAQALLSQPELLILDEPINGLDPGGIIEIRNLLKRLNQEEGVTIFISSHILSEIEKLCSHVAFIHKGELLFQGKMEALPTTKSGKLRVRMEIDNPLKAREVLQQVFTVETVDAEISYVPKDKADIGEGIRLLVDAGVTIYQVVQEKNDLEHAFLELTQE